MSEFNITLKIKLDDGGNYTTPDRWDWHSLLDLAADESVTVESMTTLEAHP